MLSICLTAVLACVAALALSRHNKEIAVVVVLAAVTLTAIVLLPQVYALCSTVEEYLSLSNISSDYISILLKSLGICFITQLSSDICRENGSGTVASQVELAGKIAILTLALPLFGEVIDMASDFLS